MSFKRDIQTSLKGTNRSVVIFLITNVAVFLIVNILVNLVRLSDTGASSADVMTSLLCLPGDFNSFLPRFWTLGTYMFVHFGLLHLLSNMLWLWFLGRIFCELLGSKRMFNVYILGGLTGGVFYLILEAILPSKGNILLGASGAVMAIVVGVATHAPDYRVFPFGIPMKLKWLALISFLLTTVINFSDNTGGKAAHIGGAVFGLCYALYLRKGNIFGNPFQKKAKLRVAHKRGTDTDYNVLKTNVRKRVDEILDKISRSGYDSLTKDEKEFLQKNHDKL